MPTYSSTNSGVVSTVYGINSGRYQATETVSDQAGKTRVLSKDGLGRLTVVLEDPANLQFSTSYSYDSLDNLASVQQSSLGRSFSYSSLRRLLNSVNPESGSISYGYDNDGNVITKSDPRVTTCWGNWAAAAGSCDGSGYDSLNEPTLKSYSDGTPAVSSSYSGGRLLQVGNSVSSTAFTYDGLGRIQTSTQQTLNQSPYTFQYAYNLTDALTS